MKVSHRDISRKVFVGFHDNTSLPFLRLFKSGFRHCFAMVEVGNKTWITYDPLSHRTELDIVTGYTTRDILARFKKCGVVIVPVNRVNEEIPKAAPLALFTCVEAIKRLLGINKRFIFTPWQLYRYLQKIV